MSIRLKITQEILKKTGKTTVCNEVLISSRFGRKFGDLLQGIKLGKGGTIRIELNNSDPS